jgi:hypothetical protein
VDIPELVPTSSPLNILMLFESEKNLTIDKSFDRQILLKIGGMRE